MFDIFTEFATDENLENNGTWFPIGKDSRLLIARAGNRAYNRALTAAVEKNRLALDLEDDNAERVSDQIKIDVMAETILLGWEKLSFKGKPIEYTIANAKKLLAVKDFRMMVGRLADNVSAFKFKEEAVQGNV